MSALESTVAAVSFLNAKPLVHGLENERGVRLVTDVPSNLLQTLVDGQADVALCPVIDYQMSPVDLSIVPVGAIGSDGPTLTVRVFSRVPLDHIAHVHADGDSHTSVALLEVIFQERYGHRPGISTLDHAHMRDTTDPTEAILLIGDKVVHNEPDPESYPHQLDLGEAWKELTGLPFVFACWMARANHGLGELPGILTDTWAHNRKNIPEIAAAHADGWPPDLAKFYLEDILRYDIGDRELQSIELFWTRCKELGLIDQLRPLQLYADPK